MRPGFSRAKAAALLFVGTFAVIGCAGNASHDSASLPSNNPNVVNGVVKERATIGGFSRHDTLVFPEGTRVIVTAQVGVPVIYVEKKQEIYAHPTEPITIDETRKRLQVYYLREENRTTFATCGEYALDGHGGASMKLFVEVPALMDLKVEYAPHLQGNDSVLNPMKNANDPAFLQWEELKTVPYER